MGNSIVKKLHMKGERWMNGWMSAWQLQRSTTQNAGVSCTISYQFYYTSNTLTGLLFLQHQAKTSRIFDNTLRWWRNRPPWYVCELQMIHTSIAKYSERQPYFRFEKLPHTLIINENRTLIFFAYFMSHWMLSNVFVSFGLWVVCCDSSQWSVTNPSQTAVLACDWPKRFCWFVS